MRDRIMWERLRYAAVLAVGVACLSLSGAAGYDHGTGAMGLGWLLAFIALSGRREYRGYRIPTGIALCVGFVLRFRGMLGSPWIEAALLSAVGLVLYGALLLYGRLLERWDRPITTIALPCLGLTLYGLATLIRFPTLLRPDTWFIDMDVLLQAERWIGVYGLSFLLLWAIALLEYGLRRRRQLTALLGIGLYLALLIPGVVYLYPQPTATETLRVAYTTGPYIGDFIDFHDIPLEDSVASMTRTAAEAAEQGAALLVYSEEAFGVTASEEPYFLDRCREAAVSGGIHLLVGLEVRDDAGGLSRNELVWIDPRGEVSAAYRKTYTVPVVEDGYEGGDGRIPTQTIEADGRCVKLSYLICYDGNFPDYVAGMDATTDILLLPSWDWDAVTRLHSRLITTLAIRNRVTVLKPTYDGITVAVDPSGRTIYRASTAETGYEHVQVVELPLAGSFGVTEPPARKAPYLYMIISAELMSAAVCLILLLTDRFTNRVWSVRDRRYRLMLETNIVALLSDAVSWGLDGCVRLTSVLCVTTMLAVLLTFALLTEFMLFLLTYIEDRRALYRRSFTIFAIVNGACIAATIVFGLAGRLFSYRDGCYVEGPLYLPYLAVNLLAMLYALIMILRVRRQLEWRALIVASAYMVLPIGSAVINVFIAEWSYVYPAITLSLLITQIMLRTEREASLQLETQRSTHHATHDELTGLLNRRAYDDRLQQLSRSEESLAVFFCDMNDLKYTNDHFGHAEGDRLIVRFAELLCGCFRRDEVFRISGDEFVVLMAGSAIPSPEQRMEAFEQAMAACEGLSACIGTANGSSAEAITLIRDAETCMYHRKEEYHRLHPRERI